jgi:glutamate dehydrogenase (NADP+)
MLKSRNESFEGKVCLVSGSGNVAQYTVEKLLELGARPVTMSDSNGVIYDPDGINRDKLDWIMELKNLRRGRIREYAQEFRNALFVPTDVPMDHNPLWAMQGDCAFPSATQNEINAADAENLIRNGVMLVAEGANMPSTLGAAELFAEAKILYGPAKAANCGGVAVSGLEMAQNCQRMSWSRREVDQQLRTIMAEVHRNCFETAAEYGTPGNLVAGANIAGFRKVADAMMDQGLV